MVVHKKLCIYFLTSIGDTLLIIHILLISLSRPVIFKSKMRRYPVTVDGRRWVKVSGKSAPPLILDIPFNQRMSWCGSSWLMAAAWSKSPGNLDIPFNQSITWCRSVLSVIISFIFVFCYFFLFDFFGIFV